MSSASHQLAAAAAWLFSLTAHPAVWSVVDSSLTTPSCCGKSSMSPRRSPRPRSVVELANASSFEDRTRLIEAQQRLGWRRSPGQRSPLSPRRRAVWVDGSSFDEAALVGKRVRLLEDGPDEYIEGRVASWKGAIGRDSKNAYDLQLDDGTRLRNIQLAHASCHHKSAHRFEVFQAVRCTDHVPCCGALR